MGASLKDIAGECGLSLATVTHILGNRADRYSEKTCAKVRQIADRLGYRPTTAARTMRTGRTGIVALLQDANYDASLPGNLEQGICDALELEDNLLVMARLRNERWDDSAYLPRIYREQVVDGVLINYAGMAPPRLEAVQRERDVPAVWLNEKRAHDCVHFQDFEAGRRLTEHFLALGHTRIVYADRSYFTFRTDRPHYSRLDRYDGYAAAMRAAGHAPVLLSTPGDQPADGFDAAIREAFATAAPPTAVISQAGGLQAFLESLGADRIRQLAWAAFGNREAEFFGEITTMVTPWSQLGAAGVRMLLEKVAHGGRRSPVTLPLDFHVRDSSRPPQEDTR